MCEILEIYVKKILNQWKILISFSEKKFFTSKNQTVLSAKSIS